MPRRPDTSDWQRLADAVLDRRTALGMTQQDVQAAGGPAVATMRLLEGARQHSYRGVILSRLEKALDWTPGSVQRVLSGGNPTPVEAAPAAPTESPRSAGLAQELVAKLREAAESEGKTLGQVLEDGGARPEELTPHRSQQEASEADEIDAETQARLDQFNDLLRAAMKEIVESTRRDRQGPDAQAS